MSDSSWLDLTHILVKGLPLLLVKLQPGPRLSIYWHKIPHNIPLDRGTHFIGKEVQQWEFRPRVYWSNNTQKILTWWSSGKACWRCCWGASLGITTSEDAWPPSRMQHTLKTDGHYMVWCHVSPANQGRKSFLPQLPGIYPLICAARPHYSGLCAFRDLGSQRGIVPLSRHSESPIKCQTMRATQLRWVPRAERAAVQGRCHHHG